jgi:hypothetical protein
MTHKTTMKVHKTHILVVYVYESCNRDNKSQPRQHYIPRTFKPIYQSFLMHSDLSFLTRG